MARTKPHCRDEDITFLLEIFGYENCRQQSNNSKNRLLFHSGYKKWHSQAAIKEKYNILLHK
jgi:hypothetical protein